MPFRRVLALSEMKTVWSRIWTCGTTIISDVGNHYTPNASQTPSHTHIWSLCSMAYQPLRVIQCQSHPCRRMVVVHFYPLPERWGVLVLNRNSTPGVWTRFLRYHSLTSYPVSYICIIWNINIFSSGQNHD